MASERIRALVVDSLVPGEDEMDVLHLIDVLAGARAATAGRPVSPRDEDDAAKVLCLIFDMVKTAAYRETITDLRQLYRGVDKDPNLQQQFRASLSPRLLSTRDVRDAIRLGPEALFELPAGMGAR
jgi:hypothetical protein